MIRLLICFSLFLVSCSTTVKEEKVKTSEDLFHEYIGSFFSGNNDKVFELSSAKNIKEASKYFREIGKISSEAGMFDSQLFGVKSFHELKSLSDDKLYKNLIHHTLQSFKSFNKGQVSFKFVGETSEGSDTRYIVYKVESPEKFDFLDSDTIKTIRIDKEDEKWKFSTFDLGDPKFKTLALSYKRKSLHKRVEELQNVIKDIAEKIENEPSSGWEEYHKKIKDMTVEERIQRLKEKTLR